MSISAAAVMSTLLELLPLLSSTPPRNDDSIFLLLCCPVDAECTTMAFIVVNAIIDKILLNAQREINPDDDDDATVRFLCLKFR